MLTVYSKDACPNCVNAIQYLEERNVPYKVIKIVGEVVDSEKEIDRMEFIQKYPSVRSAPYIVDEEGNSFANLNALRAAF